MEIVSEMQVWTVYALGIIYGLWLEEREITMVRKKIYERCVSLGESPD